MISVVVPLYNKVNVVGTTIGTVFSQTNKDIELVIVNDGSTDGSAEKVRAIVREIHSRSDMKIKLVDQENRGVAAARNRGIKEASGEYIAFLDADDEWEPSYLSKMQELIVKYPDFGVWASAYAFKEGGHIRRARLDLSFIEGEDGELVDYFRVAARNNPPIWTSAVVVSKKALIETGGFPEYLKVGEGEDIMLWAQLACEYRIAITKQVLAYYVRDRIIYSTVGKHYQKISSPREEKGTAILSDIRKKYDPVGIKEYIFLWHKMRFQLLVNAGERADALVEWTKCLPRALFNMDCWYRIALMFLPWKMREYVRFHVKE